MNCKDCVSRRRFLEKGIQIASTWGLAVPLETLLVGCGQNPLSSPLGTSQSGNSGNTDPEQTPVTPENPATPNLFTFPFVDYPQLQNTGESLKRTVQAQSGNVAVAITRVDATTARTVSTICTHQGCSIGDYDPGTQQYTCPCHGSVFNSDGTVSNGPAASPLPSYVSTVTGTGIEVIIP